MNKTGRATVALALLATVALTGCNASETKPANVQASSRDTSTSIDKLEVADASVRNPHGQVSFTARVRLTGLTKPARFSVDVTSVSDDVGTTSIGVQTSIDTLTNGLNTFTVTAPSLSDANAGKKNSRYVVTVTGTQNGKTLSAAGRIAVYKKADFSVKVHRSSKDPSNVKIHGRARTSQLVGKKLVVYFKPKGSDSFKKIGKAKVKLDGWKWSLQSDQITSGTFLVKFPGKKYLLKRVRQFHTSF